MIYQRVTTKTDSCPERSCPTFVLLLTLMRVSQLTPLRSCSGWRILVSLGPRLFVNHLPPHDRQQHLCFANGVHVALQVIPVDDDQIGELAGLEAALVLLFAAKVGVVDRVEPQGLFAGEALFWKKNLSRFSFPSEGDLDAEPGVPG